LVVKSFRLLLKFLQIILDNLNYHVNNIAGHLDHKKVLNIPNLIGHLDHKEVLNIPNLIGHLDHKKVPNIPNHQGHIQFLHFSYNKLDQLDHKIHHSILSQLDRILHQFILQTDQKQNLMFYIDQYPVQLQ
jgi:hypothetical protein